MATLNLGSSGDEVKALQQYLLGLGYTGVKADGIYGPVTQGAVKQFQLDNGLTADGVYGTQTAAKTNNIATTSTPAGTPGTGLPPDDPSKMYNTDTGVLNPKFVPKTQAEVGAVYNAAVTSHPEFAGNSKDALAYASSTGDFSGLLNSDGKPFTQAEEDAATSAATAALQPGFDATKNKDTADTTSALGADQTDYNNFLNTQKENFQTDKTNLDQDAANNGVLFSGGRIQKQQKLQTDYSAADAAKAASTGNTIANTARNYQYSYGNNAANQPTLSQYYQLGGNNYNAGVAKGGATSSPSLSSIYNPGAYNYQGTTVNANNANVTVRAANSLAATGNKLVGSGYNNQF